MTRKRKRVIGTTRTTYDSRSDEYTHTVTQHLQERVGFRLFGLWLGFWLTVDREEVPAYAWIQSNTLGFTDWKSKWYEDPDVEWARRR